MSSAERAARPLPASVEAREAALLAPYAMRSADSRGRRHPEPAHAYRGPFQRDRDRIIHSSAYRRLSAKTQVFTGEFGDYHRTRLTHTLEVASVARTIGRALALNEDLIEALALVHDLGHPPFGHSGEYILDECLRAQGGFSHNRHALRLVEELEVHQPDYPGLNLSLEVLDSQTSRVEKQSAALRPLLEAQVVDAADSITYDTHDADDALELGLLTLDELFANRLWAAARTRVERRFAALDRPALRRAVVHELIDWQVGDIIAQAAPLLASGEIPSASAARQAPPVIHHSPELIEQKERAGTFPLRPGVPASRGAPPSGRRAGVARRDVRRLLPAARAAAQALSAAGGDSRAGANRGRLSGGHDRSVCAQPVFAAFCPAPARLRAARGDGNV